MPDMKVIKKDNDIWGAVAPRWLIYAFTVTDYVPRDTQL